LLASSINFTDEQSQPSDGPANMARDCELLANAEKGQPGCRVYDWDGPWISLGFNQNPQEDLLNPDLVPWVMRPTGGKAVLHGNDVTVGLALPLSAPSRSIKSAYRAIAQPLIHALNKCGLPAALAEETRFSGRGPKSADCFAHVSPNDIVHRDLGIKVCGCALRLTAKAVLVQASIPNGPPLVDPQMLFAVPQSHTFVKWDNSAFSEALKQTLQRWCSRDGKDGSSYGLIPPTVFGA